MKSQILRLMFGLVLAAASGCTTTASLSDFDKPDLPSVVARYQAMEGPKVLAVATEANGRFAWAIAAGEASEADALKAAQDRCRKTTRAGGMRAQCIAFAIGNSPAPDTVKGCADRKITSRRCEMQKNHQALLAP